jgi:serine-type D-Ala-D-Ala carboxypeptidase (penicillin-binding protein 5/6)
MTGCGTKIENAYDTYSTDYINGYNGSNYFASNLCVTNDVNFGQDNMHHTAAPLISSEEWII